MELENQIQSLTYIFFAGASSDAASRSQNSVPRKAHRAVSSTYLDQQQPIATTSAAAAAAMVTSAESCPWNDGGPCSFMTGHPPQPPSSPPPTPPNGNRHSLHGGAGGISDMGVTDAMGHDISRYYS